MEFLLDSLANALNRIAGGASTHCIFFFFEPQMPESLKEEI